jgi:alkaline phosphatase
MKKFALALMAASAAVLGFGIVADAYPISPEPLTVDNATPGVGEEITVTANCASGETVTFETQGDSATATCSAGAGGASLLMAIATSGTASAKLTMPSEAGTYTISVTGSESGDLGSLTVVVVAQTTPATTVPTGGLPATGSDGIGFTTGVALGLLVVGLGLFAAATVRRRQPSAV